MTSWITQAARTLVAAALMMAAPAPTALAWNGAAEAAGSREQLLERYIELVGWLTDVAYTPTQKQELRRLTLAHWENGDQERIAAVERSQAMWEQLRAANPMVRTATLAQVRPGVLVELAKDARENGAADSRWMLEQFRKAHPPLAEGRPDSIPLTRDIVDANLDYEYFLKAEVQRQPLRRPDAAARQAAYAQAARDYASLTTEQQLEVAKKPGQLALERGMWEQMNPQLRAFMRLNMGVALTGEEQMLVQQIQSGGSNQMALLQNEMRNWQQNSDTIMGRGTTWNSTLGRWEQHGGIVTEYDTGVKRLP